MTSMELHAGEGANPSPPLIWRNVPADTKSLTLIVEDPDERASVHWVVYNIPPHEGKLTKDIEFLPGNAQLGLNDWNEKKWRKLRRSLGNHSYIHKLFALDRLLEFPKPPTKVELKEAMCGHILAEAQLIVRYENEAYSGKSVGVYTNMS